MYLPQGNSGIALYQENITEIAPTEPDPGVTTSSMIIETSTMDPHDHDANYDSTKLLIIFMAIVFAVLLLFILIYYYCVKGMKSSTIARQAQKSTSGSITDEKARNIFAHPERHLAVDQSQRASPSPSSAEDTTQVSGSNPAQTNNLQQQQQQQPQQTGPQATGSSLPGTTITGGASAQLPVAAAPAAATANPATASVPAERPGVSTGSGAAPGDPIHDRTPSTNTLTESQVALAAATLSTSESMGGSQAHKSGNQHASGRKSTAGAGNQQARGPIKSKLNAPTNKAAQQSQQQQQLHSGGMRQSPQKVADVGGRGNSMSAKTGGASSGGNNTVNAAAAAAAAKKSKTKSGSGKMTIVGTLANLRDTLKDTRIAR